jgi:hypothetical protein
MDFLFSSKKREEKKAADELLAAGDAEGAWKIYQRLEHKAGLAAVGEHLLAKGSLRRAAEAFAAAGQAEGVRRAAEVWLERGHYNEWIKTLKLGGTEATPAEHARAARVLLEKGDFHGAEKAFALAEDHAGLRALAERYLGKNDLDNAARLLRKLGVPAELAPLAERHLQRGDLDKAAKLFAEAGDEAGLQCVAERRSARAAAAPPRPTHVEDFDPDDPHRPV